MARPTAQSRMRPVACRHATSASDSARNDCATASSKYITAARLARIEAELSQRDIGLLHFVSACRLVSGKQLVRFWTPDDHSEAAARAGRRALKRLSNQRILDPLADRARGGVRGGSATLIYKVGVAGIELLAAGGVHQRRLGTPGERYIAHTLSVTELVVQLHAADVQGDLELIGWQTEPTCWRPFLGSMGARQILKPDLFIRIGAGPLEDRWFIECDLGSENRGALQTKIHRYLAYARSGTEQQQHGIFPRVLFAVPTAHRATQIKAVIGKLPQPDQAMFAVCLMDEMVAFLAAEARS
jgi:hypothetical protein